MKLNKTLMITALVVGSLWTGSTALQAQNSDTTNAPAATPRPRGPGAEGLMQALNLTEDQKTKVKPILDDMAAQMRTIRGDTTLSMNDKRTKLKDLRDATTAKLKDILTPEQLAKWQKMGPGNRRPPAAPSTSGTAPTPPSAPAPQQ